MTKGSRKQVLLGATVLLCGLGTLYGCADFLVRRRRPAGTLERNTLVNKAGVEGPLIAAYFAQLDVGVGGSQASAVSNWVWGSVTSDDAYKGAEQRMRRRLTHPGVPLGHGRRRRPLRKSGGHYEGGQAQQRRDQRCSRRSLRGADEYHRDGGEERRGRSNFPPRALSLR